MESPLKVGANRAPETGVDAAVSGPAKAGKARRIAKLSAAAAVVVGVGAASALFVDYLADRALARATDPVVVKPVVDTAIEPKLASLTPSPDVRPPEVRPPEVLPASSTPQALPSEPVQPEPVPIEAVMPDAAAIAKVAVGPEHAVELPTDDPTASPMLAEASPADDAAVEDETITAAISPEEEAPEPAPPPRKKQKSAQAEPAARQVEQSTEVASLPGVEVNGFAANPSAADNGAVQTLTRQAATEPKNLGGVPAGPARITAAVKLRSGPGKSSGVLGVVPAGSSVSVVSCNGWCQIDHGGQKGWVYKNFLAAQQAQPTQKQDQETADNAPPARRVGQSPRL